MAKELKARVEFRVRPNARRSRLAGMFGTIYKLDVSAPAIDGQANEACVKFLSELTGVPWRGIRLVRGQTSRSKLFEFIQTDTADIRRKLDQAL
jgi:hypothetical protein